MDAADLPLNLRLQAKAARAKAARAKAAWAKAAREEAPHANAATLFAIRPAENPFKTVQLTAHPLVFAATPFAISSAEKMRATAPLTAPFARLRSFAAMGYVNLNVVKANLIVPWIVPSIHAYAAILFAIRAAKKTPSPVLLIVSPILAFAAMAYASRPAMKAQTTAPKIVLLPAIAAMDFATPIASKILCHAQWIARPTLAFAAI